MQYYRINAFVTGLTGLRTTKHSCSKWYLRLNCCTAVKAVKYMSSVDNAQTDGPQAVVSFESNIVC